MVNQQMSQLFLIWVKDIGREASFLGLSLEIQSPFLAYEIKELSHCAVSAALSSPLHQNVPLAQQGQYP
jgi:hypothetical protein